MVLSDYDMTPESSSTSKRIKNIKQLVQDYFVLEYGELIDKHTDRLRVFDIKSSKERKHHHSGKRVYITRRSLKHFVEKRKNELSKYRTESDIFERLTFAIEHIQETILEYDKYEEDRTRTPPGHFYTKDYSSLGMPNLRILLDETDDHMVEICSIHFARKKT